VEITSARLRAEVLDKPPIGELMREAG